LLPVGLSPIPRLVKTAVWQRKWPWREDRAGAIWDESAQEANPMRRFKCEPITPRSPALFPFAHFSSFKCRVPVREIFVNEQYWPAASGTRGASWFYHRPPWQLPVTESIALPPDRGEAPCLPGDHLAPCAKSQQCWHASPPAHQALTSGRSNALRAITCISARASLSIR
jgi:hypothetical protein